MAETQISGNSFAKVELNPICVYKSNVQLQLQLQLQLQHLA